MATELEQALALQNVKLREAIDTFRKHYEQTKGHPKTAAVLWKALALDTKDAEKIVAEMKAKEYDRGFREGQEDGLKCGKEVASIASEGNNG